MDDFTEDTNPFHTDPDEVSNLTDESNVNPNLDKNTTDDPGQPPEPPELPSKRAYPAPRPQNQGGYKTALDRYLHSGEDVEIHVCTPSWCIHATSHALECIYYVHRLQKQ
jgi:sorting nexin-41/42